MSNFGRKNNQTAPIQNRGRSNAISETQSPLANTGRSGGTNTGANIATSRNTQPQQNSGSENLMAVSQMKRSKAQVGQGKVSQTKRNLVANALAKGPSQMVQDSQKLHVNTNAMAYQQAQRGEKSQYIHTKMSQLKNQLPGTSKADVNEANQIAETIRPSMNRFKNLNPEAMQSEKSANRAEKAAMAADVAGIGLTAASIATGGSTSGFAAAAGAASSIAKGKAAVNRHQAAKTLDQSAENNEKKQNYKSMLSSFMQRNRATENKIKSKQNAKGAILTGATAGFGASDLGASQISGQLGDSALNKNSTGAKIMSKLLGRAHSKVTGTKQKLRESNADSAIVLQRQQQAQRNKK